MKGVCMFMVFLSNPLVAQTRLDLYEGEIVCIIDQVCVTGMPCTPNTQFLREIRLNFRSDGTTTVNSLMEGEIKLIQLSPTPTSGDLNFWHFAWMQNEAPNTLQIGFGYKFVWTDGVPALLGFELAPPVVRIGTCESSS